MILYEYLKFANAYAACTTTREGALAAMATGEEIRAWIDRMKF